MISHREPIVCPAGKRSANKRLDTIGKARGYVAIDDTVILFKAMKPAITIEYCPGCRWLLRAGWTAQELLTTFEAELGSVALRPSETAGTFDVCIDGEAVWVRKEEGRFPEMKELKQRIRDVVNPKRDLGHSDR